MQIQSLGAVDYMIPEMDPNYLGAADDALQFLAETVGSELANRAGVTVDDIVDTLRSQSVESRDAIAASFVASGGDVAMLNAALNRIAGFSQSAKPNKNLKIAYGVLGTASMAAGVYHGYKRNQSIGWALWWGLMGGMFPVVVPVIAVAQGFGKAK